MFKFKYMKHFSILLFLAFQLLQAQHTVTGTFIDSISRIKSVGLYKFEKGTPNYLKYVNISKNKFTFSMDKLDKGYYRVLYRNTKTGYVDFIYNNENVSFTVDSNLGQPSVVYQESRENELLYAYTHNILALQRKLDSIQLAYFTEKKSSVYKYKKVRSKIEGAQDYYESLAKNDFCLSMIKASKRYNSRLPYKNPNDYVEGIKTHFFDYVNFKDTDLKNSLFIKKRVSEYVFYLHQDENQEIANKAYVQATNKVLSLTEDVEVKEYILADLIEKLIHKENSVVLPQVVGIYKSLPADIQNYIMLREAGIASRTLLGVVAPNIKISKEGDLYSLKDSDQYLVIFWSSTCSHCRAELPKVDKYLGNKRDMTVIAVGLEKEEDKQGWLNNIKFYTHWKNVIALGKWDSKEALDYNINETPSYFLLDKEKHILAKPKNLEELKKVIQ